jgi:CRISPR-associated protein Cpf1
LPELIQSINEYDLSKIYLKNDLGLTDISQQMFKSWSVIQMALNVDYDKKQPGKIKKDTEKYEEERRKYFKRFDSFSIQYINECLFNLENPEPNSEGEIKIDYHQKVEDYFKKFSGTIVEWDENENEIETTENFFVTIEKNYNEVKDILNAYDKNKNLSQNQNSVSKIKNLLDSIKAVQWFVKPLLGKGNEPEKDEKFYGELTSLWTTLDQITPLYNKVRNYMTRKPYSTEKIKLNFENSTLLDGWDVNKEDSNNSILFQKNDKYYLGIMNKKYNKIFKRDFEVNEESYYKKMEYKLLPGANKMLPKVFFSKSRIDEFAPSKDLMERYGYETHKKGDSFCLNDCHNLIDFFKASINKHEDWKNFNFQFSDTKSYEDLSGFYREVEHQGYKVTFRNIPESYINQMVDEGKLYLFQIYNKDFSEFSNGTPNMHTLYWKMLFDPQNLKDVVYKLNGQAEVFYRKSSINKEDIIIHKANNAIDNKNTLNEKKQSKFEYDIIKDRRFTVDKFQFHVPITMNFKAAGLNNINAKVNQFLKEDKDIHIIGLDRGERHLLYLTLIDMKGNIKEQFSLNEIINEHNGNMYTTNYHDLLDKKEGGRDEARKNWKTIETIKELKEGYLSQVIHKISELMIKYNAIVVLEDLNIGFMRGRQKVEKQVYQKFEKMLIDKLNYLVNKKKSANELTGTLKALQLTNKFESFQKMGKQSGFLFYVPAWNTSKMDPVTGFVNLFYAKYENVEKAQEFFGKFESIKYNSEKDYFEFTFDYEKFTNKAEGTRTKWTLCTYGNRIETFRNTAKNSQWESKEINLTNEFTELFEKSGIDYKSQDLKNIILAQTEKKFFESMFYLIKLTLQMRNSITGTDTDYLISPVANEKGEFFDSRKADETLPKNADANGAYNIARKGLWVVEQIKHAEDLKKIKLAISNKEWLSFAQNLKKEKNG